MDEKIEHRSYVTPTQFQNFSPLQAHRASELPALHQRPGRTRALQNISANKH
jgi:hypothetical protein